jgi:hypothetical protein
MSIFIISAAVLLLFIAFIFSVFILTIRYRRIILWVCFGFVALGFLLYTASYLSYGMDVAATLFAALRGAYSVARMFSVNDDHGVLTGIQGAQWLTESVLWQIPFWLCHIAALVIVYIALITLFGRKLIDSFRLSFGAHKEVYIIKGSDKNAILLAENIVTHDAEQKHPDKKRLIVFLPEEDDDENKLYEKASRFGGIVQVQDRDHDFSYWLKKAGLVKRNRLNNKKYYIVLMSKDASVLDDVRLVAEYAKENAAAPETLDVFVFISSEWDREKIEEITQEKINNQSKYPCTFHIVNEVDLLIRQMIEKHPPFECPGLNFSGGKAARNFSVMILGFGPVGQSALLRLMMNGQFVGSRMRAIIVDKDINDLRDCFLRRYPELKLCCNIEFKDFNVQREEFFKLLDKEKNVDYIVSALHSDEINKKTALDIRHHYERKDIKDPPFIAVAELNGSLRETKRNKKHEAGQDEKIFVFGSREDVYKESVIIREQIDRMAKTVNNTYRDIFGGYPWHELDWFLQESNRAAADFIPAMLKLAGCNAEDAIERKTLTDNNSLAEILAQTEHLRWNAFHAAMGYLPISIEEMNRRFKEYQGAGNRLDFARRDAKARLQVCLVRWDELDKVSKAYRELERLANNDPKRNFKDNDRDIVRNIPKFLEAAKADV